MHYGKPALYFMREKDQLSSFKVNCGYFYTGNIFICDNLKNEFVLCVSILEITMSINTLIITHIFNV